MKEKFINSLYFPEYHANFAANGGVKGNGFYLGEGVNLIGLDLLDEFTAAEINRFLADSGIDIKNNECAGIYFEINPEQKSEIELESGRFALDIRVSKAEYFRAAVYKLERLLMSSKQPEIAAGVYKENSGMDNCLSRCCYSPIKRPPFNYDELLEKTDYYPEAYLSLLSHEHVTGVWISGTWRELAETSFEAADKKREARIIRLNQIIEKCEKYGIKVWLFCIEPFNFGQDDAMLQRHPELGGADFFHRLAFCPSTDEGKRYIYESVKSIFSAAPKLGGMLNISLGERGTTCLSSISSLDSQAEINCPNCHDLPKEQIMQNALHAMSAGVKAAGSQAKIISWLYLPYQQNYRADWVYKLTENVPDNVIMQFNFESGGEPIQLGKKRKAGDYWLSYVGPGGCFKKFAAAAKKNHTALSAKIQTGTSLEIESIPSLPVPLLLYRKFKKMHELGVSSVMESWFFGSKFGVMSEAAGLLTRWDFCRSDEEFLLELAGPVWQNHATEAARSWRYFSNGYREFPVCFMFQYYSPVSNGLTWPLELKLRRKPLSPSWKPDFPPSGDAVGECLSNHTLDEVINLLGKVNANWQKGLAILLKIPVEDLINPLAIRQLAIAEAAGIQLDCAQKILEFYQLRDKLLSADAVAFPAILDLMAEKVKKIIKLRERMLPLLEVEGALGYHSEAEIYIYDREKIISAIQQAKELLEKTFVEVRQNPIKFKIELPSYEMGSTVKSRTFSWCLTPGEDSFRLAIQIDKVIENSGWGVNFMNESGANPPKFFWLHGSKIMANRLGIKRFTVSEKEIIIEIPAENFSAEVQNELISVVRVEKLIDDHSACENSPASPENYENRLRLNLWYFNPSAMFLIKE